MTDRMLRDQLVALLRGGEAHAPVEDTVRGFPLSLAHSRVGYWPLGDSPPTANSWDESISTFCSELVAMQRLVADPQSDPFALIPHGDGQTLLREAMLVADHNSYHLGQLLVIRRGLRGS
jgi:hypothetical protein